MTALRVKIPRKNKYGAVPTMGTDGFRYDSKRERNYGESLLMRQKAGEIRMVLRQVPFHLPGKVKLVLDFVWFAADGLAHFEDVKSPPTKKEEAYVICKKLFMKRYPEIEFREV